MRAYIIRRLLMMIPTLLLVSILVFLLIRFIPGDVYDQQLSGWYGVSRGARARSRPRRADACAVCALDRRHRAARHAREVAAWRRHHDRGADSPQVAVTLELGLLAIAIGLVIALPVGIYSAIRRNTLADYAGRTVAVVGLATPNFWLGLLVIVFPAIWWNWTPPIRMIALSDDLLGNLGVFIIPSLILGTYFAAATMRMTRTMMLEVLRQDYVRTAWSKGLRERVVVVRHAIKNALIPVITLTGLQLPILIGGSVIMENIFNLPGIGRLLVNALLDRDYPMVSGVNLVFAAGVVVINLVVDLLYAFLDPRVRYR